MNTEGVLMKGTIKGLATLALLTGVFGFATLKQKEVKVSAGVGVQTHRRVYAYLEGDWSSPDMYIHYFGGASGTDWNNSPKMVRVLSDYWHGLWYYDVPVDVTAFVVKNTSGSVNKLSDQSVDISIADLFLDNDYKVAAVKAWVNDGAKRLVGFADNAPGNNGQVAEILAHIDSCSDSYASGYNAWPQLNDLFVAPSTLDGDTIVNDKFGEATTISNKVAMLQSQYTNNGGNNRGFASESISNKAGILAIGGLSVLALGGYALLKKKQFI
jgi:hypothetical protein